MGVQVQSAPVFGFPAGVVVPYAGSAAPAGWLFCAGQLVSTTTYAALFAAIGTTYGSGSGLFGIPDLRGRVVAGTDTMLAAAAGRLPSANKVAGTGGIENGTLGDTGGQDFHKDTVTETAAHAHDVNRGSGTAAGSGNGYTRSVLVDIGAFLTQPAGGDGYHNTVQPTIVLNYMIATGGP